MNSHRWIILFLLLAAVILAAIRVGMHIRRDPDVREVVVRPQHASAVRSPAADLPAVHESVPGAFVETVDPRYDEREATHVAERMQALIDAAAPVQHDDITNLSSEFAVTPAEGLRQMAESTGLTVDVPTLQPYSRAEFIRDKAPADSPQP